MVEFRERLTAALRAFRQTSPKSRVSGRELATASMYLYQRILDRIVPDFDEVVQKHGRGLFGTMVRRDETCKMGIALKIATMCSTGLEIRPPESDRNEDLYGYELIKEVFETMDGTLERAVRKQLMGIRDGFSVVEIIPKILDRGEFAGAWGIESLREKPSPSFQFDTDEYGRIRPKGLLQRQSLIDNAPKPLRIDRFLIWSYQGSTDNPYGISDLRPAYRHYFAKDMILRYWDLFLEKFASPSLVGWVTQQQWETPSEIETVMDFLANLQGAGAAVFPDPGDDMRGIEMLEATRAGKAEYDGAIRTRNRAILTAINVPSLITSEGESGAYSLGVEHSETWLRDLEDTRQDAIDVFNEQVVRRVVDQNTMKVLAYPSVSWRPFNTQEAERRKRWLVEGISVGALDPSEPWIRDEMGWEERPDDMDGPEAPDVGGQDVPKPDGDEPSSQPDSSRDTEPRRTFAVGGLNLTPFEQKVRFAAIESDLDKIEAESAKEISAAFRAMRDDFLDTVERSPLWRQRDYTRIDKLGMPRKPRLVAALGRMFARSTMAGIPYSIGEIEAGLGESIDIGPRLGVNFQDKRLPAAIREVVREFEGKVPIPRELLVEYSRASFTIAGTESERIVSQAKSIMQAALRRGASGRDVRGDLAALFEPYILKGEVDAALGTAARLDTIVRTNQIEAFSTGRMNFFREPDVWDVVEAFQYSAVIDKRTTDLCQRWHRVILAKDDPLVRVMTSPCHYNCRSIWSPITLREAHELTPRSVVERLPRPPKGFRI